MSEAFAQAAPQTAKPADGPARFAVIVRGVRVGTEQVDVAHTANNIRITASGQLAAPFELTINKFEMTYSNDWQPLQLTIEGQLRNQVIALSTSFGLTTATNDIIQATQRGSVTHQVSPRAVVLPNNFYSAYEALAARLGPLTQGNRIPVYVAPESEVSATINRITPRRIVSPEGATDLRQFELTVGGGPSPATISVWIDERSRLARVEIPAASLLVIREDLANVLAREERIRNPGDESAFIGARGFSLGATVTVPQNATGRAPAVILVGGPGRQDRDETMYGVSIFGQLAGRLAEAGYLVVRYDKRGLGQSGGRTEHAGIPEYAEDVIAIVTWLRKRDDVDPERIAVVSHAEGAAVALAAAQREKRIKSLALLAAPGRTGRELSLEQQQRLLERLKESPPEAQAKIALQMRVMDAVVTGKNWETIPPELRRQADTPWFKSWLLFDPAVAISKIEQPILILHGSLDTIIPPSHADRLEAVARARKKVPAASNRKVIVAGVNHLLIPAKTGDVDEYETLNPKTVAPDITSAIIEWLKITAVRRGD